MTRTLEIRLAIEQAGRKALEELDKFYDEVVTRTCKCGKSITESRRFFPRKCQCGKRLPDPRRDNVN